mgnify:CR=1 FL=1
MIFNINFINCDWDVNKYNKTVTITKQPSSGTAGAINGYLKSYTPNKLFKGKDNIKFTVSDGVNTSEEISGIPIAGTTTPSGIPWASTTTPHFTRDRESIIMIGPVLNIIPYNGTTSTIIAHFPNHLAAQYGPPANGEFIMFSKDNKVNLSSILGYYSLIKLRNNSTEKGEIFSVAADFVESSK